MRALLLFAALTAAVPAFCNPPVVEHADLHSQAELEEFLEGAHAAIEGEDPKASILQRFLTKLNFRRQAINRVRFYNLNRESSPVHASNVVFMLGVSHATETLSGPVYLTWSLANGVPWQTAWATAAPLFSLALPGIDWVCLALVGTYAASEDFRDVMTSVRIYSIKGVGAFSRATGLADILDALIRYENADEYLRRTLETYRYGQFIRTEEGDEHVFTLNTEAGNPLVTLRLRSHRGALALQSATFVTRFVQRENASDRREVRRHLKRLLQPFGWNIRDAVLTGFDKIAAGDLESVAAVPFTAAVETREADAIVRRRAIVDESHPEPGFRLLQRATGGLRRLLGMEDHHHGTTVETTRLAEDDPTLGDDVVRMSFFYPAIQLKPVRHWEGGKAWSLVRQKAGRQAARVGHALVHPIETGCAAGEVCASGALALGNGLLWVGTHPREVGYALYRGGLAMPLNAGLKTVRIGTQIFTNTVKATVGLLDTAAWVFDSCLGWVLRNTIGLPPTPAP